MTSHLYGVRGLPSRFSGRKRQLSPADMSSMKRPRSAPELHEYEMAHQYVLQAAALILHVSVETLLSLALSSSSSSSRNNSSESLNLNETGDGMTPPESSESDRSLDSSPASLQGRAAQKPATAGAGHNMLNKSPEGLFNVDESDVNHQTAPIPTDHFADLFTHHPTPDSVRQYSTSDMDDIPSGHYSPTEIEDIFKTWRQSDDPVFSISPYDEHHTRGSDAMVLRPSDSRERATHLGLSEYNTSSSMLVDTNTSNVVPHDFGGIPWSGSIQPHFDALTTGLQNEFQDMNVPRVVTRRVPSMGDVVTKGKRRGPFRQEEQRLETALTRRNGACIRCSIQRIKCIPDPNNPSGCCQTCIHALTSRTRWLPCLRDKITDSQILDHDICPRSSWTTRWKRMELIDITTWENNEMRTICVTQGIGNTTFYIKVRKFVPVEGDALSRFWKSNGITQSYQTAPYAIADMREAGIELADHARRSLTKALRHWVDGKDLLLNLTYNAAYKYSSKAERQDDRALLETTLRLWAALRLVSQSDYICGEERLGMRPQDYGPSSENTGKILTPPVFSAQMEIIVVVTLLKPAKDEILRRLRSLMHESHRRSWLAIYLCVFVVLHSCALLTAKDNQRARKQGIQARFLRPRVIEELHNGAKILLAYFHHANRGSYPLHMDWTSADQIAFSELKDEQVMFMRKTVKLYEEKAVHFRKILENNSYEDEFYFIAQLYERDWKPRHTLT